MPRGVGSTVPVLHHPQTRDATCGRHEYIHLLHRQTPFSTWRRCEHHCIPLCSFTAACTTTATQAARTPWFAPYTQSPSLARESHACVPPSSRKLLYACDIRGNACFAPSELDGPNQRRASPPAVKLLTPRERKELCPPWSAWPSSICGSSGVPCTSHLTVVAGRSASGFQVAHCQVDWHGSGLGIRTVFFFFFLSCQRGPVCHPKGPTASVLCHQPLPVHY